MSDSFQPEMLSALLDGRLSAEQKATVDAHLASHPQDAQVVKDLKRLCHQLRSLPALSAPATLRQKILQQIQKPEPESETLPVPFVERSFRNTAWLFACAASLVGLIVVGVNYRANRIESSRLAESQSSPTLPSPPALVELAKDESIPVDSAKKTDLFRDSSSTPDGKSELMPPVLAPTEVAEISGSGGAMDSDGLADQVATENQTPMAEDPELGDHQQAIAATANCVSFDQLIVVQVPTDQMADTWIASVFQRADVQVDATEPNSFAEQLRQRELALAKEYQSSPLASALEEKQKLDGDGLANRLEQSLPVVPKLVDTNAPATAYMIEADVEQVRQILDRLNDTTIIGFPNPSQIVAADSHQKNDSTEPKAFPANPAIARRLHSQFLLRGKTDDASKEKSIVEQAVAAEPSQSQRVIDALGLENHPTPTRHRILFVFHAAAVAPVVPSSRVEPSATAAPENK